MPTADQLSGVAEYGTARVAHERAESALVESYADAGAANAALDQALARGDDQEAKDARAKLNAVEARRDKVASARDRAAAEIAAARARAIGLGAGFDLLSSRHPLLLLPVRLETRFAWIDAGGERSFAESAGADRALLVRVYPDEVHDDPHEPELTDDELKLMRALDKRLDAASDMRDLDEAWADVIRRVGPLRAGWLGELLGRGVAPGRRPGKLSRPSIARLLPDGWLAIAELADGSTVTERSPHPVREPLETGPSPDGIDWMISFDAALKAGMGLVLENLPDVEITRLVVLGARGTLDPDESATELELLLDAHHYTRGLGFLASGTSTNSLPGARAGYSSRPELEDVVPLERRRFLVGKRPSPLCQAGDDSDASALAAALGIDASAFAYVKRADATDRRAELDLMQLLGTATQRRLARQLDGILDQSQLSEVLGFAVNQLSPAGHLPTLRIGNQPYGVLPVLLRDDARIPADSTHARLLTVLDRIRGVWSQAVADVPWVGDPAANPGETVVRILQRDAVARRIAFRPLLGPKLGAVVANRLGRQARSEAQREAAAQAIDALGAIDSLSSGLLDTLHLSFAPALTAPLVAPPDALDSSPQHPAKYLDLIATLRPDQLLSHGYGAGERPRSLLFSIARLAMLESADAAARQVLVDEGGEDPADWDEEDVPPASRGQFATPQRRLDASDPGDTYPTPLGFHLSVQGARKYTLAGLRDVLDRLAERPPELLEELLRSSLGLFSHRLDTWYTAIAFEWLTHATRADPASATGVNVGAYGIVEHLRASPVQPSGQRGLFTSPLNGGYVHAPSVNQGAAAAVLRSIHLGHHAAGHGDAFSVDLSSERVRRGLELLEGIREGQPLSALLGYRIERGLAAEKLQRLIAPLRGVAPLIANKLTPSTEPAETVAASNVIDGLTLLEDAGYDGDTAPSQTSLWGRHSSLGQPLSTTEGEALDRVLGAVAEALDATADLAVAESVYQTVAGNPTRAGATVDGLAGAPVPPPEAGVVRTPRTGIGVTHRLLVLLGDSGDDRGWPDTPRGLAEPRLDAWARATLPRPELIGIRARFLDDEGTELAALDDLTLASLHEEIEKQEELRIGALDLVLLADPDREPQRSSFEQRLAALIELVRPEEAEDAALELVYGRHEDWDETTFGVVETLEIARQLRDAISRGRALAPQDLESPSAAPTRAIRTTELEDRARGAAGGLAGAITALQAVVGGSDTAEIRRALFRADALGIAGAAPDTVRDTPGEGLQAEDARRVELDNLHAQAGAALVELRRRDTALAGLPADEAEQRLQTVFGETFTVLPAFAAGSLQAGVFANGSVPKGAGGAAARTWLSRAAPVRASSAALDAVLGYADAVAAVDAKDTPAAALNVGQLGGAVGERWVGLPPTAGERIPAGRVSLVAATVDDQQPADAVAGVFMDEWVEVVPSAVETTSVAFHYDAPTACAPQVMLLGVPPPGLESWGAGGGHADRRGGTRAGANPPRRPRRRPRSRPAVAGIRQRREPGGRRDRARRRVPHRGARLMSKTYLIRTEARSTSGDLAPGLAARIADPLWLLGRQWQFGELLGDDAGSPVGIELAAESAQISRFVRADQTAGTPYDPAQLPLDALAGDPIRVAEAVDGAAARRRRARVHARASRGRRRSYADAYRADYAIEPSDAALRAIDPAGARLVDVAAGRIPDGRADLRRHRDRGAQWEGAARAPGDRYAGPRRIANRGGGLDRLVRRDSRRYRALDLGRRAARSSLRCRHGRRRRGDDARRRGLRRRRARVALLRRAPELQPNGLRRAADDDDPADRRSLPRHAERALVGARGRLGRLRRGRRRAWRRRPDGDARVRARLRERLLRGAAAARRRLADSNHFAGRQRHLRHATSGPLGGRESTRGRSMVDVHSHRA